MTCYLQSDADKSRSAKWRRIRRLRETTAHRPLTGFPRSASRRTRSTAHDDMSQMTAAYPDRASGDSGLVNDGISTDTGRGTCLRSELDNFVETVTAMWNDDGGGYSPEALLANQAGGFVAPVATKPIQSRGLAGIRWEIVAHSGDPLAKPALERALMKMREAMIATSTQVACQSDPASRETRS